MKVCDLKKENDNSYIFPTDGKIQTPRTSTTATKPGQQKRIVWNDKTRSVSKKRKI